MHTYIDTQVCPPELRQPHTPRIADRKIRRPDRFELAVLAAFALVSVWVLSLDLWQVVAHGLVWTGSDGIYGVDQFQYEAWIRDASRHILVSNLFVLHSTPADYFQPAIAISGVLSALGVSPTLSLLMWKPVAVLALFYAVRRYVNRSVDDVGARRAALVLALFFGSFTIVFGSVGAIGDMFPGFLAWGYPFGLLGLAAMVGGLLTYDRARGQDGLAWWPGVLGAAASLLHPWNGALLIAVVVGAELVIRRPRTIEQLKQPALTVALTGLPLAYYVLLGRIDLSWRLAKAASKHTYSLWAVALELAPLLLPALITYRRRPRTFLRAANMVWPVAAFALFWLSSTRFATTPIHAVQGITIPLSLLAVEGLRGAGFSRLPHPAVCGVLLVAAFTIPATAWELNTARTAVSPRPGYDLFITRDENRALRFLADDPRPGGVISRQYLGQLVPGATGRHTFVGDCLWSQPRCSHRLDTVRKLFAGQLDPDVVQRIVALHGARFLLADCRQTASLEALLSHLVVAVHRFGCATVYDVDAAADRAETRVDAP
jgi:hypothetical protein